MRKTISSYIVTLRLKTEIFQEDLLEKRVEISRKMYNACINELYQRYRALQQSKSYQKAKNDVFSALNKQFGLFEYSIHAFLKPMTQRFK